MTFLSEKQYLFVQSRLDEIQFTHGELKEELFDHLCSDIEFRIASGMSFSQASQATFDTFNEDEIKDIEKQTILLLNQNHVIMKKVSMLTLAFMLFATLIWALQEDPPSIAPLKGDFKVTAEFGKKMHPVLKVKKHHKGIDFKAPIGTPVYATSDGIVEKAKVQDTGAGIHIIIRHDEAFQTAYYHLSKLEVKEGQKVKKGDLIGAVGSTGFSTGPHLHYEVRKNGTSVDPEPFLKP